MLSDTNSTAVNAAGSTIGLNLVTDDCQNGDVQEEESSYELSDDCSVERPLGQLRRVKQRRWRWILIVSCLKPFSGNGFHVLRHN
ncbi:hypothetical protein HID58_035315 [Brassica napus]|uniref:Uncharacterized protein n=1 Tax=Brassica napus TaxID=3708 RepID=A0ABQ8C4M0_BRANA|nr:hypothetical protein HID58_035315 [Brassica napus]